MQDLEQFAELNNLKVNQGKTQVMLFNKARKWDFPPELKYKDGSQVKIIEETKLVGVMISSNLKWESNTRYICQKARAKLWLLRRVKQLGLGASFLFDLYTKEIRSILEMAVPVWHSSITNKQSNTIERIQKMAFRIILGEQYQSYHNALNFFGADTLHNRRIQLCSRFALKNLKSDVSFFEPVSHPRSTRKTNRTVKEFTCNSSRFAKTSLPFLSKLINKSG